jgi:hypothetical protein
MLLMENGQVYMANEVKGKLSLCLSNYRAIKTYGGVEV